MDASSQKSSATRLRRRLRREWNNYSAGNKNANPLKSADVLAGTCDEIVLTFADTPVSAIPECGWTYNLNDVGETEPTSAVIVGDTIVLTIPDCLVCGDIFTVSYDPVTTLNVVHGADNIVHGLDNIVFS